MLRKKSTLLGLVIFILFMLVLSGCGGSKSGNGGGNGGGNDDPVIVDFDAEAFKGTSWRCTASGDRPQITVNINEIASEISDAYYFSGSVECSTTGTMTITGEEEDLEVLWKHICLMATEIEGEQYIIFMVAATNDDGDYIQINGYIESSNPNTVIVNILVVNNYEYDSDETSEIVKFNKVLLI